MDNKLYIGTMIINDVLHLTSSENQDELIRLFLVSRADYLDEDLAKVSEQMKLPIYNLPNKT